MNYVPGMRQKQVPTNRENLEDCQTAQGLTTQGQSPILQTTRRSQRPSWVRVQGDQTDPARSEARGPAKTQRGRSPEGQTRPSVVKGPEWSEPKEARQTRRGQRPKGPGEHRSCGVASLIHQGVSPGGRGAPGSKPQTEPVQLVFFPGWSGPLAVFCVAFTGPLRSGLGRLVV